MSTITLTNKAISHFSELLAQENEELNIRMNVEQPGTINADLAIRFCPVGENQADDLIIQYESFKVFLENNSAKYLKDAVIDYALTPDLGGELIVRAPLIRGEVPNPHLSLAERVNFVLYKHINPNLASHGGEVALVDVQDNIVRLAFGGGCQGCGMAQVTLKNSVEKTLLHYCNDIVKIEDITEHDKGHNPYF